MCVFVCVCVGVYAFFFLYIFLVSINIDCFGFDLSKIFILILVPHFLSLGFFCPYYLALMLCDDIFNDQKKILKISIRTTTKKSNIYKN